MDSKHKLYFFAVDDLDDIDYLRDCFLDIKWNPFRLKLLQEDHIVIYDILDL